MKSFEELSFAEKKSEILSESNKPGVVIADVARRYGINPSTLYNWRSEENNENTSGDGVLCGRGQELGFNNFFFYSNKRWYPKLRQYVKVQFSN